MSTVIPVTESGALFKCPPDALLQGWSLNGFSLETKGNDCYMEYPFTGTGVSVLVSANWDHGPYSCQLDGGDSRWFNANSPTNLVDVGCSISGIANQKHTLRVTNAPISVTAVLATLFFASIVATIYLILQAKSNLLGPRGRQQSQARAASPDVENEPATSTSKRNSQYRPAQEINTHNVLQQLTLLKERDGGDYNIKQTSADEVEEPEKPSQAG
ncbi:hypothetical protein FS837_005117 [Tulasnella sp. UAMH 9824]|nr:hypothetical protein FS837_005117 [Tulasnella sp. UAMH 9824]